MRCFKLALAAGASIVVAAKLSPAYALPPVAPLDLNGPIRQGHACIAPYGHRYDTPYGDGQYYDTGPGYNHFYDCGPEPVARQAHHAHHRHHEHHPAEVARAAAAPVRPAVYRPLDINGPVRQGDMCIVHNSPYDQTGYGYWSSHFEPCAPNVVLARYHGHALAHHAHAVGHHPHAHHARLHHRKHHAGHLQHAQFPLTGFCENGSDPDPHAIPQFWQPAYDVQFIDTMVETVDIESDLVGADLKAGAVVAERDASNNDGGLLAQLFDLGPEPQRELGWTRLAAGASINHDAMNRLVVRAVDGVRRNGLPASTEDRPTPIAPALLSVDALGRQSSQPGLRPGNGTAADEIALTGAGYSSPAQPDAAMAVVSNKIGVSPLAAVLGLALIVGAPLMVLATQFAAADKAAVVETVSDPASEWDYRGANTVIIEQRIAAATPRRTTALD